MTVSTIIAADLPAFRRGLRAWLEELPDFRVLGDAKDATEAVRLVKRSRPDVLVIDMHLLGLRGSDVLERVRTQSPRTRGVVVANLHQEDLLIEAFRRGALAYVLYRSDADVLIQAVRAAAQEEHFLDPAITERPIEYYLERARAAPGDGLESLTLREKEVLSFVAEGYTSPEIARRLHLSARTVEQHRARLRQKIGCRTHTELVFFALRHGIISWKE